MLYVSTFASLNSSEADGEYTSSDGCQRGYSTGDVGRRSNNYPADMATRPAMYPTVYEQGHGQERPYVHAENDRIPRYVGVAAPRESAYAPLEPARQTENFHDLHDDRAGADDRFNAEIGGSRILVSRLRCPVTRVIFLPSFACEKKVNMDLLRRRNRCRQLMPVSLTPGRDGTGIHGSLSYGNLIV